MLQKKYALAITLILAITLSACQLPYSSSKKATPVVQPTFATPLPTGSNPMAVVEGFATGTALALTAQAGGAVPGTPTATLQGGITATPGAPVASATFTPITGGAVATATATSIVVGNITPNAGGTQVAPTAIVNRPATYTLQQGEFVFCIARRFNVDPNDILALNGLVDSETVYPGTVLKMPQSGSFPGDRALRAHPATYVVTGNNDTSIYAVACIYGDADPARIAQANNLPLSSVLKAGQSVSIP